MFETLGRIQDLEGKVHFRNLVQLQSKTSQSVKRAVNIYVRLGKHSRPQFPLPMRNIESKVNSSHRYIVNNEVLMLQVNLAGENVWKRFQYATCINDRGGVVVREFGSHSVDSLFILLFSNINALKMVLTDLLVGAQQRQQSGGVNLLSPCWRHNNSSSYLQSFRPVVPNPWTGTGPWVTCYRASQETITIHYYCFIHFVILKAEHLYSLYLMFHIDLIN